MSPLINFVYFSVTRHVICHHLSILFTFQLRDMSYFIIIVTLVLLSFGIVRQAIHFQDREFQWLMVRNVFFYPYWMIYGELFADEIDSK
jgi:hypothetical protein